MESIQVAFANLRHMQEAPPGPFLKNRDQGGLVMKNWATIVLLFSCCALAGCGSSTTTCKLTAINVSPQNATADHAAAAPGNQMQFAAFAASATPGCAIALSNLTTATWSVSDPVAVSIGINAQSPNYGNATCVAATVSPVTVTATVPAGDGTTVSNTSSLSCK
jgi:hypothetical protein